MSQGRLSFFSSANLTNDDLSRIVLLLTSEVSAIECEMAANWQSGKFKIAAHSANNYWSNLNDLVKRLRNMAENLFHDTRISKVKPYHQDDDIPDNFRNYLQASKNIASLVTHDILHQPSLILSIATFERWLYVCKTSFHQHDFFTSSCIMNGLNSVSISISKIENKLCETSTDILVYYRNMLDKASLIYIRQNELLKYKLDIIPSLHVLVNMHDKLDYKTSSTDKAEKFDKLEIQVRRRTVSKSFSLLKKKNSAELITEDDDILSSLYKKADEELYNIFDSCAKKLKEIVNAEHAEKMKKDAIPAKFSIAAYTNCQDDRVELITTINYIRELEQHFTDTASHILYNIRAIICNVQFTDRITYFKIHEEFTFNAELVNKDIKLDKRLRKLHEKLSDIFKSLIKDEIRNGKYFHDQDLENHHSIDDTSSTTKSKSVSVSKSYLLQKRQPKFFGLAASSSLATEECTPKHHSHDEGLTPKHADEEKMPDLVAKYV